MENGNGAVRVRAAFYNMTIRGGSNYTISWIKYEHKRMFQCFTWLTNALFKTLKKNQDYVKRLSPYRAVNTLRLSYKNQPVNAVQ